MSLQLITLVRAYDFNIIILLALTWMRQFLFVSSSTKKFEGKIDGRAKCFNNNKNGQFLVTAIIWSFVLCKICIEQYKFHSMNRKLLPGITFQFEPRIFWNNFKSLAKNRSTFFWLLPMNLLGMHAKKSRKKKKSFLFFFSFLHFSNLFSMESICNFTSCK